MLSLVAMDYFRQNPLLAFPLAALAIFMGVFFVVTLRTVLTSKSRYASVASLPLELEGPAAHGEASSVKEVSRG
jgi:hypothetical protein